MCTSIHLHTFGHILKQSCRSHVESPSCSVEHSDLENLECVLILRILWRSDWLGFRLDFFLANHDVSPGLF